MPEQADSRPCMETPRTDRPTDTTKNITFPQLNCRAVINDVFFPVGYGHSNERPSRDCEFKVYLCLFNTSGVFPIAQCGLILQLWFNNRVKWQIIKLERFWHWSLSGVVPWGLVLDEHNWREMWIQIIFIASYKNIIKIKQQTLTEAH